MESGKFDQLKNNVILLSRAKLSDIHEVIFEVKRKNIHVLEQILLEVSDPHHQNYGKFKTHAEIGELTTNQESYNHLIQYLRLKEIIFLYFKLNIKHYTKSDIFNSLLGIFFMMQNFEMKNNLFI